MTGHNVRGEKPRPQWQMAAVHHRASRHGCLSSAASTFPSRANSLQRPALAGAARGANEAVRPPSVRQILRARFLIGKTRVERLAGHRSVIFPSGWHRQNNTRTSWIGKPCNTTSCAAGSKGISLCPTFTLEEIAFSANTVTATEHFSHSKGARQRRTVCSRSGLFRWTWDTGMEVDKHSPL
jgi:hypothetical protein